MLERYGRIDILINNAGYALHGAIEKVDIEAVTRMFNVNVNGVIRSNAWRFLVAIPEFGAFGVAWAGLRRRDR